MRKFYPALIFLFLLGANFSYAQNILEPEHPENDTIPHYPDDQEVVNPTDVDADLNGSFPKPGSVFGGYNPAAKYWKWKKETFDKVGIKFALNYTAIVQGSPQAQMINDSVPNWGAGGWFQAELQWTYRKGKDFQGNLTVALDWRHAYGANTVLPGDNFQSNGSVYGLDGTFLAWDIYFQVFFWEQHFKKGKGWIRLGNIAVPAILDFNRFKDARVAFSNTNFAAIPVHVMPMPPPGMGGGFRWNFGKDNSFYIAGAFQDMNIGGGEVNWSNLFEYGEVFAGIEFGKNWRRGPGDFDHVHITIFYADKVSAQGVTIQDQFIPWPSKAGWGIKILGEKQWNRLVVHGNYTYTTVEGGHVGVFGSVNHSFNMGLAYLKLLNVQGELGFKIGVNRINPNRARMVNNPETPSEALLSGLWSGFARDEAQYGGEVYWKILMLPDLWMTPGMQFIVNPIFNNNTNFIFAPSLKARFFF